MRVLDHDNEVQSQAACANNLNKLHPPRTDPQGIWTIECQTNLIAVCNDERERARTCKMRKRNRDIKCGMKTKYAPN